MNLRELVDATELYVRGELKAQDRLSEALDTQSEAVRKSDTELLIESCERLEAQFASGVDRERTRRRLLAGFGKLWNVDPNVLSLGSIAERLGPHGEGLAELRIELRNRTSGVMRKARKLSALARYQQGIFEEILHAVAGEEAGASEDGSGVLLNAEA